MPFKIIAVAAATLGLVAGCQTTAPDNVAKIKTELPSQSRFWAPPADTRVCNGYDAVSSFLVNTHIQGWMPGNPALSFMDSIGRYLAGAVSSKDFEKREFVAELVKAAEADAYTVADFEGKGGPSPTFMQSLVLISISYAFSYIENENLWRGNERQTFIDWGNDIRSSTFQIREYRTMDHVAADATASMVWGAATSQKDVFADGFSDFHAVAGSMNSKGEIESSPRDNNEDIQFLILAAEAAMANGVDAYKFSYDGKTLHDAIKWHAENTLKIGRKSIYDATAGSSSPYFRSEGHVAHIGWAPIYLSRFPDGPASPILNKMLAKVDLFERGVGGRSMGGPTECLWGWNRGT